MWSLSSSAHQGCRVHCNSNLLPSTANKPKCMLVQALQRCDSPAIMHPHCIPRQPPHLVFKDAWVLQQQLWHCACLHAACPAVVNDWADACVWVKPQQHHTDGRHVADLILSQAHGRQRINLRVCVCVWGGGGKETCVGVLWIHGPNVLLTKQGACGPQNSWNMRACATTLREKGAYTRAAAKLGIKLPGPPSPLTASLTTPCVRSSVVLRLPFMMRSMICSTQGFSQPGGGGGGQQQQQAGSSSGQHVSSSSRSRQTATSCCKAVRKKACMTPRAHVTIPLQPRTHGCVYAQLQCTPPPCLLPLLPLIPVDYSHATPVRRPPPSPSVMSIFCTLSMLTGSLYGSFSLHGKGTSPGSVFCTIVFMLSAAGSLVAVADTDTVLLRLRQGLWGGGVRGRLKEGGVRAELVRHVSCGCTA
jgi:hypothetical protein